jgi:hypothetical protein
LVWLALAATLGNRLADWMRYWAWAFSTFSRLTRRSRLLASAASITCCSRGSVKTCCHCGQCGGLLLCLGTTRSTTVAAASPPTLGCTGKAGRS